MYTKKLMMLGCLGVCLVACGDDDVGGGGEGSESSTATETGESTGEESESDSMSGDGDGDPATGDGDGDGDTSGDGDGDTSGDGDGDTSGDGDGDGDASGDGDGDANLCGNGMIDPDEECDGDEFGEALCSDFGFDDGALGCDPDTCLIDAGACFVAETLQNDDGMCTNSIGCTDPEGIGGNPQDIVECFEASLIPPFDLVEVEYGLPDMAPPPPEAADLVVFEWDGPGNAPGALIEQIEIDPMNLAAGTNTFTLEAPIEIGAVGFCVGLHGEEEMDGMRLTFSDNTLGGESYLRASLCGLDDFTTTDDLGIPGAFCVHPTINSSNVEP